MHTPIQDLNLSEFVIREPTASASLWSRMRRAAQDVKRRLAAARQRIRSDRELARIAADEWSVGDYGVARWQVESSPKVF